MSKEVANDLEKPVEKKKRGPKTVIVEEPIKFKGDPLSLEQKTETTDFDVNNKIRKRDDIVVERYNPEIDKGLTQEEVEARMMAGAVNDTNTGSSKTVLGIILSNTLTFFNVITFGIAVWLILAKAPIGELNFIIVVIANLVIGIFQEIKAKKTIDSLSLLSAPTAIVVRDANQVEISINTIVIDDIFKLSGGKQISADAVLRSGTIEVDESLLTGEADIIIKKEGDPLFSGSFVVSGTGYAQVVAVGKDIYVQKLTSQAKKYKKPKSELFNSLKMIMRIIGVIIIPIGIAIYLLMSKYSTSSYQEIVLKTSGAVIGMIPAGLFLLTSSALAVGVIRLAQNNTLVQELYCIEMLARIDVLCLDKTGTITDGTMSVHSVIEYKNSTGLPFKNIISAILNAQEERNLTSKALEERFGTGKRIRSIAEIPFSSARKFSAVTFDKIGTFVMGAPEFVIKKNATTASFFDEVEKQSKEGYRVIVVGHSKDTIEDAKVVGTVSPVGLIMIEDSIRPDAVETIEYFKKSGVAVRVISGDNPITVSRIAQRAGILDANKYISLDGLSDNDVIAAANEYIVFGRVSPNQKKVLVQALKAKGHTVAMTGDGVNDILALREADTSIALASGSEAARNVAHLVLLDSNFSSMPKVVTEGRRVINNIQKLSGLFLAKTLFTLLLAIVAIISKGEYPITPNQLTPINYLVIGIPTFFLAMEANNNRVEGKFLPNVIKGALPGALIILINSLIIFGLSGTLGMTSAVKSTLIVLSATVTMFVLLLKISLPFNRMRIFLLLTMFTGFAILVFARPDFFNLLPFSKLDILPGIDPLSVPQILLLIVLIQSTWPMLYILTNIVKWSKIVLKKTVKLITGV
ncbi:HAD-IC family P-type ATPase [Haploplasma axanthum]|uniref:Calcium-transporting ATPase lmo0841 n=1 Tax=Haploplasma axanthum TaxID=29552 RepID=A0A449BCL5_HAPAX|nr:HAD-IC family P-type ATPase [Haploplasma axanthum]VEU80184.1 Calcium-transporting ATPase lmo0841 [Haploplasma axanthum]